jgi:hypothetical protein
MVAGARGGEVVKCSVREERHLMAMRKGVSIE